MWEWRVLNVSATACCSMLAYALLCSPLPHGNRAHNNGARDDFQATAKFKEESNKRFLEQQAKIKAAREAIRKEKDARAAMASSTRSRKETPPSTMSTLGVDDERWDNESNTSELQAEFIQAELDAQAERTYNLSRLVLVRKIQQ